MGKMGGIYKKIINGITTYVNLSRLVANGVKVGKNPRFCGVLHFKMMAKSTFEIGHNCVIVSGGYRNEIGKNGKSLFTLYPNSSLKIGDYVAMSDIAISCRSNITIGNHVMIGGDVLIIDSNAHSLDWKYRQFEYKDKKMIEEKHLVTHKRIIIDDDVFIGTKSIITKGVHIGARSIIAVGSVVVNDIPADEIWGGNPAKFIKKLI